MALKWAGEMRGAEGIMGIPGRDLTDEEVEDFGGEDVLLATGLYVRASGQKMRLGGSENKLAGVPQEDKD